MSQKGRKRVPVTGCLSAAYLTGLRHSRGVANDARARDRRSNTTHYWRCQDAATTPTLARAKGCTQLQVPLRTTDELQSGPQTARSIGRDSLGTPTGKSRPTAIQSAHPTAVQCARSEMHGTGRCDAVSYDPWSCLSSAYSSNSSTALTFTTNLQKAWRGRSPTPRRR